MTNRERYAQYFAKVNRKTHDSKKYPYRLFSPEGKDLGGCDREYLVNYEVGLILDEPNEHPNLDAHLAKNRAEDIVNATRLKDLPPVNLSKRHPSSERFHALLKEMGEMHDRKQKDYGKATDPFANVRASQDFGLPAWIGCMIRANDKMVRLKTYATTGQLANEGVRDSFMDLAVYSIIGLCLFEETQK